MRALILDTGTTRASLSAVRGLASAGWEVTVGAPTTRGLATCSRRCAGWRLVPSPAGGEERFVEAVARAVVSSRSEVVFVSGDLELLALSRCRARVPAVVPYSPDDVVRAALDKLTLDQAALRVGLSVPRTETLDEAGLAAVPGPVVVVKERLHGCLHAGEGGDAIVPAVVPRERALAEGERLRALGRAPIVQEFVTGELMALTVLVDERRRVIARVQQRALRISPARVGCSARARSEAVDEPLGRRVAALMRELAWYGIAELQFLRLPGRPAVLIDLNGRFYGSMALAAAAGVNLAALYGAMATGRPLPRPRDGRAGVRFQWLAGDLRAARVERRGGLVLDVLGCLAWALRAEHSVFAADDPRPALRQYAAIARERRE